MEAFYVDVSQILDTTSRVPEEIYKEAHKYITAQATAPRPRTVECSELKSTACQVCMHFSYSSLSPQSQAENPPCCAYTSQSTRTREAAARTIPFLRHDYLFSLFSTFASAAARVFTKSCSITSCIMHGKVRRVLTVTHPMSGCTILSSPPSSF